MNARLPLRRRTLAGLFMFALTVRLVVLFALHRGELGNVLVGDSEFFANWGRAIAAGDWLGSEPFYQAPLYPYLLAVVFALGGGILTVLILQALLGSASAVLLACAGALLFDRRPADPSGLGRLGGVGLLAGLFAALYAPSIWLESLLLKPALATFLASLLALGFAAQIARVREAGGERPASPPRLSAALLAGLLLGLLGLLRENALVLALPLGLWLLRAARAGRPLATATSFATGLLIVLAPVALRNAALGGGLLPTASNAGVNFFIGNGASADGLYRPLLPGRGHADYEAADARAIAERESGRALSASGVSRFFLRAALADIRRDPWRWAKLFTYKLLLTLHRAEPMDTTAFEYARSRSLLLALLGLWMHFGLLLPLAVAGWWLSRRDGAGLFALCALFLAASIALFFVTARFRLALVPWLLPLAARGAIGLAQGLRDPWTRRRIRPAILLAATAAVLANLPISALARPLSGQPRSGDPVATTYASLASSLLRREDPERAYLAAALALRHDPSDANANYNLAVAARLLGRTDEALAAFERAAGASPSYAGECELEIGILLATSGQLDRALPHLQRATELTPTSPRAFYNLGVALRQSGRIAEAEAAYRAALRLDPEFTDARRNLEALQRALSAPER